MSDLVALNTICFQTPKQLATLNSIGVLLKSVLIDLHAHNFVHAKNSLRGPAYYTAVSILTQRYILFCQSNNEKITTNSIFPTMTIMLMLVEVLALILPGYCVH